MKTLGEIFRERRNAKNISLEEVESATKIRKHILADLEEGNYLRVGVPTQVKGFLKIYAEYLGLSKDDALAFYRREVDETKTPRSFSPAALLKPATPTFRFSPQILFSVVLVAILLSLGTYIWYQYQSFAGAPKLEIFVPRDGTVFTASETEVEGKVQADSTLTLNGQAVQLSQDGYFKTKLQLSEGLNVLTFVAVNEVGKSTTVRRSVRLDVAEE